MARRHRSYSLEFKRHVAQQYLSGEISLARLARQHDISRNLIRVWIAKYEAGEFDDEQVQGDLWPTEFGPRGGDELNRIEAGMNYGWIFVTEGEHYNGDPRELGRNSVPGMVDPVLFWSPVINPGNLIFYHGDAFGAWQGDMLVASMSRTLLRVSFDEAGRSLGQERMLTELGQRFRNVRQGPDGMVYVLTDEQAGVMLRIEPARWLGNKIPRHAETEAVFPVPRAARAPIRGAQLP